MILLGRAGGRFDRAGKYSLGPFRGGFLNYWAPAVADFNRDGRHDIAIEGSARDTSSGFNQGALRVVHGRGAGRFGPPRIVSACCDPREALEVAFVNADRKPDLVSIAGPATRTRDYAEYAAVFINRTR